MSRIHCSLWAFVLALGGCAADVGSAGLASSSDSDGDGDPDSSDCAPLDPSIHAGATESCNGVDDNCNGTVDEPVGSTYCVDTTPRPTSADQCFANVLVGQLGFPGSGCPIAGAGWTGRSLFTRGFTGSGGRGYCIYEHPSQAPSLVGLPPSDDGRPPSTWLEPDCPVLAPLGGTDAELAADLVWQDYFDGWRAQLEAEPSLPTTVSSVDGALPLAAHVAVLDSAPPNGGFVSPAASDRGSVSRHGASMGLLAQHLACPAGRSATCVADFTNHVALGHRRDGSEETVEGGVIGTFSQVAIALEEALTDGAAARSGLPSIVALSIGAEPGYEMGASGLRPAAQALRDALDEASCARGALVFAAAGNRTGGPGTSSGPMYPAAWASELCGSGDPLLYAVGAVDPADELIRRARSGGTPALVAPGRSVVVDLARGLGAPDPTPLQTGTSFGPVAAAAGAAILWSYAPHWNAAEVANHLYGSATPLAHLGSADFCASSAAPCGGVRRISICGALLAARDEVCSRDGTASICTFTCSATRIAAGAGSAVVVPASTRASLPSSRPPVSASGLVDTVSSPMCSYGGITADMSTMPLHPDLCPGEQYPSTGAGPAFGPQPDDPACRVCAIELSVDTVSLWINEDFEGGDLYAEMLETSAGDKIYLGTLVGGALALGESYEVEDLGVDPNTEWAVLSFTVVDGSDKYSIEEEIEVW